MTRYVMARRVSERCKLNIDMKIRRPFLYVLRAYGDKEYAFLSLLLLSKRNANYLREILLEIVGVQINVTVRHFTYTDADWLTAAATR